MSEPNFYEPNPTLERKLIRGLLQAPEFLRLFVERRVKPDVFLSKDAPQLQEIVKHCIAYYTNFRRPVPPKILLEMVLQEHFDSKERDLVVLKTQQVLSEILSEAMRAQDLPYYLEDQIERYRRWKTLSNAKEIPARFFVCKFDHGKHDLCKTCPIWQACKTMQGDGKPLSLKTFYAQELLKEKVEEATGSQGVKKVRGNVGLKGSLDRLSERRKLRLAGGGNFTFGIKTPWPSVTRKLDGWKAGELYGIFAERKTGKTTGQLMCADDGVRDKKVVLAFVMEDSEENWMDKFFCTIAEVEWEYFRTGKLSDADFEKVQAVQQKYEAAWASGAYGELIVYSRPIGHIGLDEVQVELDSLKAQGIHVDLVLIDHLHIMKKPYGKDLTRDDLRLKAIPEALKSYAQIYGCAIILAAQIKTSGDRKGHTRGSDEIEDSFDAVGVIMNEKGVLSLKFIYCRNYAPFEIELVDRRNQVRLPEAEDASSVADASAFIVPETDWLGETTPSNSVGE